MGIYHYSVSNKSFRTGGREEIRFSENHGKAWNWSDERSDHWVARYNRAVNRTLGLNVLFTDCKNKSGLALRWNPEDNEIRREQFGIAGIPVFRTLGDGTGWSEKYDRTKPVGFLYPAASRPNARTEWSLLTPEDLGLDGA